MTFKTFHTGHNDAKTTTDNEDRCWYVLNLLILSFLQEILIWGLCFAVLYAEAGVKADPKNKKAAGIMLLTLLPFVMVTLSEIFDSKSWKDRIVLITLIISGSATVVYFLYSVYAKLQDPYVL